MNQKLILGLLGPFFAAGAGWLAAAAGKYGIHLDPSGLNALFVAGTAAGGVIVVKLIHDAERKNPKLVADLGLGVERAAQVVQAAKAIDPQLAVAAGQAEGAVAADLAKAWPAEPAV